MKTLHLVSGPFTADSLRSALNTHPRHRYDRVEWFPDSLSVGPLEASDPEARVRWWQWWADMVAAQTDCHVRRPGQAQARFWNAVGDADHIVLWHGQDNAHDSAFYHAMCAKVPEVPLNVVTLRQATASYAPTELAQHMKDSRAVTSDMRTAARRVWKQMEQDNQTFRVLSDGKLISAASDYYDTALLGAIGQDWTPIVQAVAPVMANMDIGDSPLFWRIKLLIESGKLMADGNPWLVHRSKVKRTDSSAC